MFRVVGEEDYLVVFREGCDGLDGGGAAGGAHVGKGVVEEEEPVHLLEVEFGEGEARGEGELAEIALGEQGVSIVKVPAIRVGAVPSRVSS